MRMYPRTRLSLGCSIALLCLSLFDARADAGFTTRVDGTTLYFDGYINQEASAQLSKFVASGGKRVVVTSGGGDAMAGAAIGKAVLAGGIDVVVEKYCLSACANYFFLAAATKSLREGAVLGFHGGIVGEAPFMPGLRNQDQWLSLYKDSNTLLRERGVDAELIRDSARRTALKKQKVRLTTTERGPNHVYTSDQEVNEALRRCLALKDKCQYKVIVENTSNQAFYFPSRAMLEKYGVTGIENYPYPGNATSMNILVKVLGPDFNLIGDF